MLSLAISYSNQYTLLYKLVHHYLSCHGSNLCWSDVTRDDLFTKVRILQVTKITDSTANSTLILGTGILMFSKDICNKGLRKYSIITW